MQVTVRQGEEMCRQEWMRWVYTTLWDAMGVQASMQLILGIRILLYLLRLRIANQCNNSSSMKMDMRIVPKSLGVPQSARCASYSGQDVESKIGCSWLMRKRTLHEVALPKIALERGLHKKHCHK